MDNTYLLIKNIARGLSVVNPSIGSARAHDLVAAGYGYNTFIALKADPDFNPNKLLDRTAMKEKYEKMKGGE